VSRARQWCFLTLLILRLPIYAIGVYAIYKFATHSLTDAIIVGVGLTVWIVGSLVWRYRIWPRLHKQTQGNSN
jgi:cytosine/uracil/thiamine/allantoin permease